jgi:hypothetical protein
MRAFLRFSFLLFLFPSLVDGQEMIQYSSDFRFKDGIYLSFADFKNNNPVPITYIVSNEDIRLPDYLERVLQGDSVSYYDNLLEERTASVYALWGFCQGGRVFVGYGAIGSFTNPAYFDFFPLITIGRLSLLTALESSYQSFPSSPTAGMAIGMSTIGNDFGVGDNYYIDQSQVQLILDMRNGKLIRVGTGDLSSISPDLLQSLIEDDPALLTEFTALERRERSKQAIYYVRRYNERNPIYFPQ